MDGSRLSTFRITSELGSGGMGKVYRAEVEAETPGLEVGNTVALKVIHPHLLTTPGMLERFQREAEIGQRIQHANVVRTLGCEQCVENGEALCYLVMEYVEGQTLAELVDDLDRVPEELCRHIARETCRGLAAIHAEGIVHRDVKPDNVLITPDHQVKVMDLGVARLMDEALRLSRTGAFVGSVEYAAPEQFKGSGVSERTDLYALGVLLYEISTGVHPFRGGTFPEVLRRVLNEEPRRLGEANPQLTPFIEEVVHTLLAKQPGDRFASAGELIGLFEQGEASEWWSRMSRTMRAKTNRPPRRIRIPRETSVYGREGELAQLRDLYERTKAGVGRIVLLSGEAGIGKSRLVDEFISRLHTDGEDINFLFGSYPPGGATSAAGALSVAFHAQLGEGGAARHLSQTPSLAPAFDALLRGDALPRGAQPLSKEALETCFVHATQALAAERPTIILIDDLHFAPPEALALFMAMALATPGHRVLLVGTARHGLSPEWLAGLTRLEQVSEIKLPRLGPKDLMRLLEECLRSQRLAEELGVRISVKSDGNPFFVFEIIRGLREGQFITRKEDGTWATTQLIEEIEIPSSVLDLVNARVADLSQEERDLLDVACCWGFEFDPLTVAAACDLGRVPALKTLAQIERRHRLVRSQGRRYTFDHHQVQEALYGSLNEYLREEYHGALARALEDRTGAATRDPATVDGVVCVDLCEHYLRGGRGQRGLRYLRAAQTHLVDGYLYAPCATLTQRALAKPDLLVGRERAEAHLFIGAANGPLDRLGRRGPQLAAAREAERIAEQVGDERLQGLGARAVAAAFLRTARYPEGLAAGMRALDLAVASGDRESEAAADAQLGVAYLESADLAAAKEHTGRALALSLDLDLPGLRATAMDTMGGIAFASGQMAEARKYAEQHAAFARTTRNRSHEGRALAALGAIAGSEGRRADARAHYEDALAIHQEIGDRRSWLNALVNLALACAGQGEPVVARAYLDRALAAAHEINSPAVEAHATVLMGGMLWEQGSTAEALEHYERYLALSKEIGHAVGESVALHNLGIADREAGNWIRAEQRFQACLDLCEETGFRHLLAATHRVRGSLHAARFFASEGDSEAARADLEKARDISAESGLAGIATVARCELATLPDGDQADALAAYAEAWERLRPDERTEACLLLWQATGDVAHLCEAKRLLDDALSNVPEEYHDAMLTNLRINREIMKAWGTEPGTNA